MHPLVIFERRYHMKRSIRLSPVVSLAPLIGAGELVAFDVGPDGVTYLVIALEPLDDRFEQPGGASFVKTVPDKPQNYRVVALSGDEIVIDLRIAGERFNIHDVQPLPDGLLLVCARSFRRGRDDFEKNGRVYSFEGKFVREILLGDGIQTVQATSEGVIWTSYFDEGVFGNDGWNDPVGASGLVAFDQFGIKTCEFEPRAGLDPICDCYALNVASDEDVWLYYYTDFPLVRLRRGRIESVWTMPVSGSDAFAVFDGYALFRGGYEDRDTYRLFSLRQGGTPVLLAEMEFHDNGGGKLLARRVAGRGDAIRFIHENLLFRVDVRTVLAWCGRES